MDKKTFKTHIILTIVSLFVSCIPLISVGIILATGTPNCFLGNCWTDTLQDHIRNATCLFLVLSFVIWINPIIKYIKQKNNEKEMQKDSIVKNDNLSPQEKTNLVESENNIGFFLFSTALSSTVVVIMIIIAVINAKTMLSASRSGVGGMGFVTMIPFYIMIMFPEVVTTVFSIILFLKYKKLQKNGVEPTKRLKTLRKINIIFFIIILCWPVCFYIIEIAYRFFDSLI